MTQEEKQIGEGMTDKEKQELKYYSLAAFAFLVNGVGGVGAGMSLYSGYMREINETLMNVGAGGGLLALWLGMILFGYTVKRLYQLDLEDEAE